MRKNLLLILFLLVSIEGIRSQSLSFEYDTGGNQIVRKYCALCLFADKQAQVDLLASKKEFPPPEYQVKIYPNPTKDKVTLVWSAELGAMIQKVEYIAYNFTQYRELTFDKRENKVILDLTNQPIGMYVVVFHLNTGEKLTYKILKQ
ncbi:MULTISPECIES: T9SS type A sorting domain-containing protein [unclassified Chryseobacterium]|uniref:T9SS type A sorting domain-containing protein n=1 Tax=unclassified Chryseobacterium TaxID=2593645 RepID=UPI000F490F40|nr:T9SS type A sorting domain-containing protein [Chryseobacterium sp. BIGb0232]MCS4301565.1 hypothetical protein [Chryseobacterium sp. BIGb0232]ROS19580.1 hypothetical protein EDF65_0272 [Chryseobacterium nakagawai]